MKKFDVSIPRKMFWANESGDKKICPECSSTLENESHAYFLIVKRKQQIEPLTTLNDGGYFCPNCPVIVLDNEKFEKMASIGTRSSKPFEFTVAGLVDYDAIPEEKAHLPLGDDDNPIPLVKFLEHSGEIDSKNGLPIANQNRDIKDKPVESKMKVGRNEPCPCGSGRKYKKCCGKY